MQIERTLANTLWSHAVEHPDRQVYGWIAPPNVYRLGERENMFHWQIPADILSHQKITGFYQSFTMAAPPPPLLPGCPDGFLCIEMYVGTKGILEMRGYLYQASTTSWCPVSFSL